MIDARNSGETNWTGRITSAFTTIRAWQIAALVWAAIMAWAQRCSMDPDGLSYVDSAYRTATGGIHNLLNAYWSPGYPAILSAAFYLLRPAPMQEFQIVHLVNFLIFACVLLSFTFFLKVVVGIDKTTLEKAQNRVFLAFSFPVFLWFIGEYNGVSLNTPDLGVAGAVLLIASMVTLAAQTGRSWLYYVGLGFVMGAAYYLKSAMLPAGLALLAILFLAPPSPRIKRMKLIAAFLSLSAVVSPWVVLISQRAGHFTVGESARMNYIWMVNRFKPVWKGGPPDPRLTLQHGPRRLLEHPVLLEFSQPFDGTYPLWREPSYWSEGTKTYFDPGGLAAAVAGSVKEYYAVALSTGVLLMGLLVLWRLNWEPSLPIEWRALLWQIAWPLCSVAMYSVLITQTRYLSAFYFLAWIAVYRLITLHSKDLKLTTAVLATVCATLMISWTVHFAISVGRSAVDLIHPSSTEDERVAGILTDCNLPPGARLAYVGEGFEVYFAHLARMRVTAQIPDEPDFWNLTDAAMRDVVGQLASAGVKAIVTKTGRPYPHGVEWEKVGIAMPGGPRVFLVRDIERALGMPTAAGLTGLGGSRHFGGGAAAASGVLKVPLVISSGA